MLGDRVEVRRAVARPAAMRGEEQQVFGSGVQLLFDQRLQPAPLALGIDGLACRMQRRRTLAGGHGLGSTFAQRLQRRMQPGLANFHQRLAGVQALVRVRGGVEHQLAGLAGHASAARDQAAPGAARHHVDDGAHAARLGAELLQPRAQAAQRFQPLGRGRRHRARQHAARQAFEQHADATRAAMLPGLFLQRRAAQAADRAGDGADHDLVDDRVGGEQARQRDHRAAGLRRCGSAFARHLRSGAELRADAGRHRLHHRHAQIDGSLLPAVAPALDGIARAHRGQPGDQRRGHQWAGGAAGRHGDHRAGYRAQDRDAGGRQVGVGVDARGEVLRHLLRAGGGGQEGAAVALAGVAAAGRVEIAAAQQRPARHQGLGREVEAAAGHAAQPRVGGVHRLFGHAAAGQPLAEAAGFLALLLDRKGRVLGPFAVGARHAEHGAFHAQPVVARQLSEGAALSVDPQLGVERLAGVGPELHPHGLHFVAREPLGEAPQQLFVGADMRVHRMLHRQRVGLRRGPLVGHDAGRELAPEFVVTEARAQLADQRVTRARHVRVGQRIARRAVGICRRAGSRAGSRAAGLGAGRRRQVGVHLRRHQQGLRPVAARGLAATVVGFVLLARGVRVVRREALVEHRAIDVQRRRRVTAALQLHAQARRAGGHAALAIAQQCHRQVTVGASDAAGDRLAGPAVDVRHVARDVGDRLFGQCLVAGQRRAAGPGGAGVGLRTDDLAQLAQHRRAAVLGRQLLAAPICGCGRGGRRHDGAVHAIGVVVAARLVDAVAQAQRIGARVVALAQGLEHLLVGAAQIVAYAGQQRRVGLAQRGQLLGRERAHGGLDARFLVVVPVQRRVQLVARAEHIVASQVGHCGIEVGAAAHLVAQVLRQRAAMPVQRVDLQVQRLALGRRHAAQRASDAAFVDLVDDAGLQRVADFASAARQVLFQALVAFLQRLAEQDFGAAALLGESDLLLALGAQAVRGGGATAATAATTTAASAGSGRMGVAAAATGGAGRGRRWRSNGCRCRRSRRRADIAATAFEQRVQRGLCLGTFLADVGREVCGDRLGPTGRGLRDAA